MTSDDFSCQADNFSHSVVCNLVVDASSFFARGDVPTPFQACQVVGDIALRGSYTFNEFRYVSFLLQESRYDTKPGLIRQTFKKLHQNLV